MNSDPDKPSGIMEFADANGDYVLQMMETDDGSECRGTVIVRQPSKELSPEQLLTIFKKLRIVRGLIRENCMRLCETVRQGVSLSDLLLARGVPARPGKDGFVEFVPGVYCEQPQFVEDEDGSIDFRELHVFGNVLEGQLIATVRPPTRGVDGVSIHGLPIPAIAGVPVELIVGEGAEGPNGEGKIHAAKPGRVVFDGQELAVSDVYVVDGDVDMTVGHIDFVGFVEVKGEVPDGFNIRAGKGLNVRGIVGACQIISDGNIELGGMAGLGEGKIVCRGNLVARFLNDVEVECGGNLIVQNEIRNALVKCSGTVSLPKGSISGGECVALKGIETYRLGAPSGLRTEVEAGIDFRAGEQLATSRIQLHDVSAKLREIRSILAPLNERVDSSFPLSPAEEARQQELTVQLEQCHREQEQLLGRIESLQNCGYEGGTGQVNVKNLLREGVVIAIGKVREEVKNELSGPLSIIESSLEECLRYLPMTPLGKPPRLEEQEDTE